jgi:hypothetical protein
VILVEVGQRSSSSRLDRVRSSESISPTNRHLGPEKRGLGLDQPTASDTRRLRLSYILCPELEISCLFGSESMFSRVSQLARHFSRPLPNYAHRSAAALASSSSSRMTSSSSNLDTISPPAKGLIQTAGCIIIGDEVLGGKVRDLLPHGEPAKCQWHVIKRAED